MKHRKLFLTALLALCFYCIGYTQTLTQTVRFNTGKFTLSKNYLDELNKLADSLKNIPGATITIRGHADNVGKYNSNKRLSEKRAIAVKNILLNAGLPENAVSVEGLGPDYPIASNKTINGRRLNRRVEILVSNNIPQTTQAPAISESIDVLYKQLEPPPQIFCINPRKDTSLRCAQGTVIYIKANSILPKADCGNTCVTLHVKEVFTKQDIILNNLSTTSNGDIIETQGMIYTNAFDCKGNNLTITKGKDLVIVLPTDSINPTAKIFDGNRDHDGIMNWTVNNSSELSNFTLSELEDCADWICNVRKTEIDCKPCRFFFCRIARIGKVAKGIFSANQRAANRSFRACLNLLERMKDSPVKVISQDPLTIETRPPIDSNIKSRCEILEELFKKYGVKNMRELIDAINKPLYDRYGVKTMEQLQDTLKKIKREEIELNYSDKKVSFEDFKYYVYNVSNFGWSNVDCFANIPASSKVSLKVDLEAQPNVDCKLVFKDRRFVVPATKEAQKYIFKGVPRGEKAVIVAIKWENGNPFLAMKEVSVAGRTFDIEFKQLTLDELKTQLKLLDQ